MVTIARSKQTKKIEEELDSIIEENEDNEQMGSEDQKQKKEFKKEIKNDYVPKFRKQIVQRSFVAINSAKKSYASQIDEMKKEYFNTLFKMYRYEGTEVSEQVVALLTLCKFYAST